MATTIIPVELISSLIREMLKISGKKDPMTLCSTEPNFLFGQTNISDPLRSVLSLQSIKKTSNKTISDQWISLSEGLILSYCNCNYIVIEYRAYMFHDL